MCKLDKQQGCRSNMENMLLLQEGEIKNTTTNTSNETDSEFLAKNHTLATAFFVCTIGTQVSIMLCMGAIITLQDILNHFKRPISLFIAFASQFIAMPASAFGIINIADLPPAIALSAMILATSPGGSASNLFTFFLDGDVPLSIMLTTISTVLAIGFMPFNLWIYARQWEGGDHLKVPYKEISITLAWILIPLICGMIANRFTKKLAKMINQVGSILSILLMITTFALQYIMTPEAFNKGWKLWLTAIVIPTAGLIFGYFFAFISKLPMKECKTICLETGIQSVGLATTVVVTSFPKKIHSQMTPILIMFGMYLTAMNLIVTFIFRITKVLNKRKSDKTRSNDGTSDETNTFI